MLHRIVRRIVSYIYILFCGFNCLMLFFFAGTNGIPAMIGSTCLAVWGYKTATKYADATNNPTKGTLTFLSILILVGTLGVYILSNGLLVIFVGFNPYSR
jgi:hypothetical protein